MSAKEIKSSEIGKGNLELWESRWEENKLRWHKDEIDPYLIKYVDLIAPLSPSTQSDTETKDEDTEVAAITSFKNKRVFVPLCGKSKDLAYLLSRGLQIFAVEGVLKAIQSLDKENSFNLIFNEAESIFQTPNGKLTIYNGNLFECPIEKWGPFDCIWDKSSITAIDISLRPMYIDVMKRSVTDKDGRVMNFKYLLRTVNYDKSKADGRGPKCVDEEDMQNLFSTWTEIKLLESVPLHENNIIRKISGNGGKCNEEIYILTQKK